MLGVQNVFLPIGKSKQEATILKNKFAVEEGDHITYLNAYNSFIRHGSNQKWCLQRGFNFKALCLAVSIRRQLEKYFKHFYPDTDIENSGGETRPIIQCIVTGFFSQAAKLQVDGTYRTVRDKAVCFVMQIRSNIIQGIINPPFIRIIPPKPRVDCI